jgi:hypothetical protein
VDDNPEEDEFEFEGFLNDKMNPIFNEFLIDSLMNLDENH